MPRAAAFAALACAAALRAARARSPTPTAAPRVVPTFHFRARAINSCAGEDFEWKLYTNGDCSGTPAATWKWKYAECTTPPNDAVKNDVKFNGKTCELSIVPPPS